MQAKAELGFPAPNLTMSFKIQGKLGYGILKDIKIVSGISQSHLSNTVFIGNHIVLPRKNNPDFLLGLFRLITMMLQQMTLEINKK